MKKFLSILLALAVGFTFTFGSAMSAFAATYDVEAYSNALNAEKQNQINYMTSAKTQAVNSYTYDEYGFTTISGKHYSKAAVEAAADAVIADLSKKMDAAIKAYLDDTSLVSFPMDTPADLTKVTKVTTEIGTSAPYTDATTKAGMLALLAAQTNTDGDLVLDATQAPLTKAFIEGKLDAVDLSKYNSTDKNYTIGSTNVTAAEKVQSLVDGVKTAIANEEADTSKTAANKVNDYYALYFGGTLTGASSTIAGFKTDLGTVNTLEDEAVTDAEDAKEIAGAAKAFVSYGLDKTNNLYPVESVVVGTDLYNLTSKVVASTTVAGSGAYADFYKAAVGSKKATVFGVEVGNIAKVTKAELIAINEALYNAIVASETVLKDSGLNATAIKGLSTNYLDSLYNTMNVAAKYDDVVKYGAALKGAYVAGVKTYDDTKVDAAVEAAKKIVYGDLTSTLLDADVYFAKGACANADVTYTTVDAGLALVKAVNYEADKFAKAKKDAISKMYSSLSPKTAQVKVAYGDNKTADADLVYLKETYFVSSATYSAEATATANAWTKIADEAVEAITAAQSYSEIDVALSNAATEFAKLLTAKDGAKVCAARATYCNALGNYKTTAQSLVDSSKYSAGTFTAAETAGVKLINAATTEDAVKAAYEEAKALIDGVKSDADLAAAKTAIEEKIAALPTTSTLTSANYDTVKAVIDAYAEYKAIPGTTAITNDAVLKAKYEKVIELVEAEIALAAKNLNKKLAEVSTSSDADMAAYVAMKAEAKEIKAKGEALLNDLALVNDTENSGANKLFSSNVTGGTTLDDNVATTTNYEAIVKALDVTTVGGFYDKEIVLVNNMLIKAGKADATEEEMKTALDAYNKLTDAQKYELSASALPYVTIIENKLAEANKLTEAEAKAYVQDLSIAVRTAKVGKKVKVTVNADVQKLVDNGFTVAYKFYKSTKKSSGYKNTVNKAANTYTNTNPVKGKNYYKVKLVVKNADGAVVATTPLTQCKYGVRTIK